MQLKNGYIFIMQKNILKGLLSHHSYKIGPKNIFDYVLTLPFKLDFL